MKTLILSIKKVWILIATPFIEIGGNRISLSSILLAILIFYVSYWLARFIERFLNRKLENRNVDIGLRASLSRFGRYFVMALGVLMMLDTLGIGLKSLAAVSAVFMVGIGFGLQNITHNFVSGVIIFIERPIKKGDLVKVGDHLGRIINVGARSTTIHTRDDIAIIVPNSKFISEDVINQSYSGEKLRTGITIGVSYGSNLDRVQKTLLSVADEHPAVLKFPGPLVLFSNFGDSALIFDLKFWISDLWGEEKIKSEMRYAIDLAFRTNDIVIPFPQRDLHIKDQTTIS